MADRLARCIDDPRSPDQVIHNFADMIGFRMKMIAAGYEDGNDANRLRSDPVFKMAQDAPPSGRDLASQSVVVVHVLRNSMIPVVTVIALGLPGIFGGAIVTEQIFKVNGIGQLLITAIYANDVPLLQTLTFIFGVLIIVFNLIADLFYGVLDPRIRYE